MTHTSMVGSPRPRRMSGWIEAALLNLPASHHASSECGARCNKVAGITWHVDRSSGGESPRIGPFPRRHCPRIQSQRPSWRPSGLGENIGRTSDLVSGTPIWAPVLNIYKPPHCRRHIIYQNERRDTSPDESPTRTWLYHISYPASC